MPHAHATTRRGVSRDESARRSSLPTDAGAPFDTPLPDREAAAALALTPGIGPVRWRALLTRHLGNGAHAAAAHGVSAARWAAALREAARLLRPPDGETTVALPGDPTYPARLLDLPDAPPLLWIRGEPAALCRTPCVAIVGTRDNSSLGASTGRRLVAALRDAAACVVSGMARGIDGIIHDAALHHELPTVAVLATGVDVPYPAQHRQLYTRIVQAGAVVSEQAPGTAPVPGAFPRRNRIIAALAECTVVVEAGERSGALITADVALDLGRTVAAVPGPIDAPGSAGTNALLRDGAHVLASVDDLLLLLGIAAPPAPRARTSAVSDAAARSRLAGPHGAAPPRAVELAGDERAIWDALADAALDADAIIARTALTARRCAAALAALETRGMVATELSGAIRRL